MNFPTDHMEFHSLHQNDAVEKSCILLTNFFQLRPVVSITTRLSFLVKWMPEVDQVRATLPHSFQQAYSTTFAIIDGSEIFQVICS